MLGNLAYGAFQTAIMTYTKGLAREVAALEIRVNGIAQGLGDTGILAWLTILNMNREAFLKLFQTIRTITPLEDVENLVAYLDSDFFSQIVG